MSKESVENLKKLHNFRIFVSKWLQTGWEWYQEKPEILGSYRFGHDWNSDFGFSNNYNDKKEYSPGYKFGKLPKEPYNAIQSLVEALILSGRIDSTAKLKGIREWLEYNLTSARPVFYGDNDKFLKNMCWGLHHIFKAMEDEIR